MDYHANAEGVAWFSKEIYPLIKAEFENTQFHIVGSNPIPSIRALADPNGIKVTGFVEDIRPYYTAADICVVPLRLARGIQNKVLEAMAMAKPVVTTAKAAEGIAAKAGEHLLVADSPVEFARAVTGLIENRDAAVRIGANAARFVRENYNWPENMKKFEDLLKQ